MRPGTGVHSFDGSVDYRPGDEFSLSEAEAAEFLRGKNRRAFEVVGVFDDTEESGGELDDSRRG